METELTNTTHSFTDHESAIAAHEESLMVLEKEYRQVSDEKLKLLAKLEVRFGLRMNRVIGFSFCNILLFSNRKRRRMRAKISKN